MGLSQAVPVPLVDFLPFPVPLVADTSVNFIAGYNLSWRTIKAIQIMTGHA